MTANPRLYTARIDLPVQAEDASQARLKALMIQYQMFDLVRIVNRPYYPDQRDDIDVAAHKLADLAQDAVMEIE